MQQVSDDHIKRLFEQYYNRTATESEEGELMDLLASKQYTAVVAEFLDETWNKKENTNPVFSRTNAQQILDEILKTKDRSFAVHRIHFLRTAWFRYAAAIILFLGTGAYLWKTKRSDSNINPLTENKPAPVKDITPGGQRAMLTLADGSTIVLDSAANGQLALEQGSSVIKADGQVIYQADSKKATAVSYNKMSTPKGGQYQLTLADGTKAWLNAASSITYPTAFIGTSRIVKVSGEVYFEVAVNKDKPFIVETATDHITVLGTHFNVNAYPDEAAPVTTLLEGSVKIENSILQPGEAYSKGKVSQADVQQAVAWKNGKFRFGNGMELPAVMRQIARWYDVEVIFEKPTKVKIGGSISSNVNVSKVLELLSSTGLVKFKVEGKRVIVVPVE